MRERVRVQDGSSCLVGQDEIVCLAIPMQVVQIEGQMARCTARGVEREVSLFLLPTGSVAPGDWLVVHVGYAIQKMTQQAASTTWEMLDGMLAAEAPARDA